MVIEPVGKPKPKPIPFRVYKRTIITNYGNKLVGEYRGKIITVHNDLRDNTRMIYVEKANKWIKSKLIFFKNGIKNIIRSKAQ